MVTPFFHSADYQAIKPEILLAMFGLAILLFDFLLEKRDKYMNAVTALAGLALAGVKLGMYWFVLRGQAYHGFGGAFTLDSNSRASVPSSSVTTCGEISNTRLISRSTSAATAAGSASRRVSIDTRNCSRSPTVTASHLKSLIGAIRNMKSSNSP